ncbi:MAG: porin family protein [Saprospiraceae bacterium]|nr:porin family protein [Saprospiraceae bacterium]
MRALSFYITCTFCFGLSAASLAQQRFTGGLVVGLTASQIDGDESAGYNKLGLMGGGRAGILLSERWESSLELLFVQRGAQNELVQNNPDQAYYSATLNYIEVPIQIHFKDWLAEDADNNAFYRMYFNAGFSYARLMGTTVEDDLSAISTVVPDYLNKNDFSILLGATFFANRHLGFNFRWVRSLAPIYEPADWDVPPASEAWRPHSLYFSALYVF